MPFSKEWDDKPKILIFPFRRNNGVACQNCYHAWPKDLIHMFTGLCPECTEENPVAIETPRPRSDNSSSSSNPESVWQVRCLKCSSQLKSTNFGIQRNVCYSCMGEERHLKQRCFGCDKFFKDCWNNVCRRCRFRRELCEETGYFYRDRDQHRRMCWCLKYQEQVERASEGTS